MAKLEIKDLEESIQLDRDAMKKLVGGKGRGYQARSRGNKSLTGQGRRRGLLKKAGNL